MVTKFIIYLYLLYYEIEIKISSLFYRVIDIL
jgi:hypothetical protein